MMRRKKNNFGKWINAKASKLDISKAWLEKRANVSIGSICRYVRGSAPVIDNYFALVSVISKVEKIPLLDVVQETLDYMPYLISYQNEPKCCPTCGQHLQFQKNPQPRQ